MIRDVVDYCPLQNEDSFYRYPLYPGGPGDGWLVANGNFDSSSPHGGDQQYAWDITAPLGKEIRAARGDRVVDLVESETDTSSTIEGEIESDVCFGRRGDCLEAAATGPCTSGCSTGQICYAALCMTAASRDTCLANYPCSIGNYLWIRHQDDTVGIYFHMRQNGVTVNKGQRLDRSNQVGEVGDTGMSTTEHLHFQVHDFSLNPPWSIRSRFQAALSEAPDNLCRVPLPGENLPSSNDPSAFY